MCSGGDWFSEVWIFVVDGRRAWFSRDDGARLGFLVLGFFTFTLLGDAIG